MAIKVNVDNLHEEIMKILMTYGEDGSKAVNMAVREEAAEIRQKIRQNASAAGIRGRHYKGGWQIKESYRPYGLQCTVYNGSRPGLAHLLEKGHNVKPAPKRAGRKAYVQAMEHIAPATSDMDFKLIDKIENNLGF